MLVRTTKKSGVILNKFLLAFLFSVSSAAFAEECFQLSNIKDSWSRTPELLCVAGDIQKNEFTLSLKSGMPFAQKTVAVFNLNLLERARCVDCNQDVFGLTNPSNSTFNALSIKFDGVQDILTRKESGTVTIGTTKFFYQSN